MILTVAAVLMTFFFLVGLHVAAALGLIGIVLMTVFSDRPLLDMLGQIAWNVNSSFVLVAVPLFILMGEILVRSRASERLYRVLSHWLAPLPGGLLHSNVAACAMFAAASGSSAATAATIGSVSLPAFRRRGYSERLAVGSLAAGGTLGILIPPSISFIIYGVLVEESIGRLYMAGFIPGFLLAGVFMVIIAVMTMIWPPLRRASGRRPGASGWWGCWRSCRWSPSCSSSSARSTWGWRRPPRRPPSGCWARSSWPLWSGASRPR